MKIVVCIKQVPDTEAKVEIDSEKGTLIRTGVPSIINPFDTYAIEEGLILREKYGGTVTVITMGPPQAREALEEALAMGADKAILLSDREFAGADTLATSYTLSLAIRKIGKFDLAICGKETSDGNTAQVGPGLSQRLGASLLTYVSKVRGVDLDQRKIIVERLLEEGKEIVEARLPALLTVVKDINQPRSPSLGGVMRAAKMEIPVWTAKSLSADTSNFGLNGSATQVIRIFTPPPRPRGEILKGEPEEIASLLVEKLMDRKAFLKGE